MTVSKAERRVATRIRAKVPVSVKVAEGNLQVTGHTRDLSDSGIFFYTDSVLAEGSELEMVLILPPELTQGEKRWVCCQASVVRLENGKENNGKGKIGVAARIQKLEIMPEMLG
ncbi:MAG TPA: PilZ domain-containing protein [Terriglobales bacterium]|nr:PilZ domain-containing protein [Terriglobales bacterium]